MKRLSVTVMAMPPLPAAASIHSCPVLNKLLTGLWRARWSSNSDSERNQAGHCPAFSLCSSNSRRSDPHRHHNIAVFVFAVAGFIRPQLPCSLCIFELKTDIPRSHHLQELQEILRVESDHHGIACISSLNRIF